MSGSARTTSALKLKKYDRVSPQPEIDLAYAAKLAEVPVGDAFCDENVHAKVLNNVFQVHDVDGIYINLSLSSKDIIKVADEEDSTAVTDICGAVWKVGEDDVGSVKSRDIKSLEDERLYDMNPYIFGAVDVFKGIDRKWLEEKAIITGVTGAYSHIVFMYGLEETMMAMYEDPEKLHELLNVRTGYAIERIDELADEGCRHMWIGEGAASGSLISPRQYEEFVLPYEIKMAEHMKRRGVQSILHVCGNISRALDKVKMAKTDGIDLDYMNDIIDAKSILGDVMCIKGNINPVSLQDYSSDEVVSLCRSIIEVFPENKGLILSTGCLVTRDTPPGNIDAMIEATMK